MNDPTGPTGILIVSHGSPRAEANERFRALVGRIAARLGAENVLPAFFSIARPSIADRVAELAAGGVTRIVLLPYFLSTGQHVTHDIPALVEQCRRQFPAIVLEVLPTLENDPALEDVVVERLTPVAASAVCRGAADVGRGNPTAELPDHHPAARCGRHCGHSRGMGRRRPADRRADRPCDGRFLAGPLAAHSSGSGRAWPGRVGGGQTGPLRREDAASGNHQGPQRGRLRDRQPGGGRAGARAAMHAGGRGHGMACTANGRRDRGGRQCPHGAVEAAGDRPRRRAAAGLGRRLAGGPGRRPGSETALLESDLCYITNTTARGGSPVAAAAVNALASLEEEQLA